ncbi:hypothetical protein RS030_203074 [Cryptosporidium xiaoi]|uniref:Uncharacterized protein n=1 Tax=Cryptosporidium xiaoi TaxID=659607 RepID=A0AAV9XYF4_9CRYT
MNNTFQYLLVVIYFVIFLNGSGCTDLAITLDNLIKLGYSEDDFNPLFVEELNDIKKNPDLKKKDKFYARLRSGQWFALRQQVEYESSELGLKRVVGVLPVNPFFGGIFTPSVSEIELADNICEALMEMRNKGLADKIGLKIAKDGLIRQKFCEEAAALYFNGLRQRPMTVSQKQNEAEQLGTIEYLDSSIDLIPSSVKLPMKNLGAIPKTGGKFGLTGYQEAELIAKQTLIRNFVHVVKLLHLDTLRRDPLRLREYFPGTITQIRHALDTDNPEIVAARLLQLGPTSDLIEEFINNHRGRRDLLLMKAPKTPKGKQFTRTKNDELFELISNTDFSSTTFKVLESLAYKHVALTPMIRSTLQQLFEFIEKNRDSGNDLFVPNIVSTINLLPELVKAEMRVFFELNSKTNSERINTIEKVKSMIKNLQPVVRTFNNFDEEEIKLQIKDTVSSQNELNYYSRAISRIILTMLERRKMKIKEEDPEEIVLLSNEPSVSLNSLIDILKSMNNKSLSAIVNHIEKVVPNFTNKSMYSEATPQQKQEILALVKIPTSPEISKQLFSEPILRSLLSEAIPNQGGLLDRFVKGFYILMGETGVRLQSYLRNGYDTQNLDHFDIQKKRVFAEDNLRHNSVQWLQTISNLFDDTLFNYELATRRLIQYMKECKLGIKFGSNEKDLEKNVSEISKEYLQKLLDNMDQIKFTERKINALFLGEKGNLLILPNRRHHLINYMFNKDGDSLFKILNDGKHYQVLLNIIELLEEIQLPKKEEVEIDGPYWDRTKNEWVNAEKLMKNEVEVKVEPQKVTDLPITREQEWERIALFSKWSDFVKGIPIEFIPHGYKFSFGLYSNFINFCQRGIREIAYRLIVRDKGTNTEPEGKYWEYLPRNRYSVVIKADNSKDREEKVLSFCNAVYISIYGEKGVPDEYKKELPRTWSKETDKYEKELFITPQEKQKNKRYILDDVNEQWEFIAKEARKPGILMAPNLPTDSSLLGDVWRNLYIEKQLATSSVDKVEDKISILSIMCVEALNALKLKKNYYGQELYKIVCDSEDAISTFCHDTARRWFKEWPSEITEEILLMKQSSDDRESRESLAKSFDRSYLKKHKSKPEEIRPGYLTTKKVVSPVILEDFGRTLKQKKKLLLTEIPEELGDEKKLPTGNRKKRISGLDSEAKSSSAQSNESRQADRHRSKIQGGISKEVMDIIGNIN